MGETFIQDEFSNLFLGELVEDMIETVKREKKLYCNVLIPDLFTKDSNYPLTYVPLWAMSLPLKKGDKVLVKFNQEKLLFPVLYKNPNEIDSKFFDQFNVGKSVGDITPYTSQDTIGCTQLGENSYIIKTNNYTVIHQNNGFILIDKDDKVYIYGSEINIMATKGIKINSSQQVTINNHLKVI